MHLPLPVVDRSRAFRALRALSATLAVATVFAACEGAGSGLTGVLRSAATLSSLSLSTGSLQPVFDPATTTYASAVNNATDQITVTATATTPGATILIQGAPVANGAASQPIVLFVGSNQIDVVVTNPDGLSSQTYTITVQRSAF